MFLKDEDFFTVEKNAPIMNLENNYYSQISHAQIIEKTASWLQLLEKPEEMKYEDVGITPSNRIICHDAERVYLGSDRRKKLSMLLSCYEKKFNDYHQGLALTSGFLLLTLNGDDVATIISTLATDPKYIPQYWQAEAITAVSDAYVMLHFVEQKFPQVAKLLKDRSILPETYATKWFVALCVPVLPYAALYRFFELFLEEGRTFIIKFGISLFKKCEGLLFEAKDHEILEILRLESKKVSHQDKLDIVENAKDIDIEGHDLVALRKQMYETHLKKRIEDARNRHAELKKEEESEDSEDEEGAECGLCEQYAPEMWCKPCKIFICDNCHEKPPSGDHKSSHDVDPDWEKYEK